MRLDDINEGGAGPEKCWPGHRKVGTKPGTGKNAGKRVNDCEKIKEDVDVVDQGEYDREGDMAIGQLNTIEDAAAELRSILDAEDNLPEWVQSKITKAVDYIDTARDYMKSKDGVTEVSKSTLDRYVSKAVDAHGHADFAARQSKNDPTLRSYHVDQKKTAEKRRQGISRALDRMSKEGVAEGVAETMPMTDAVKVLRHYGARHFKTTSNELHFYKNGQPMSVDLIWGDDGNRSVNLSQLNSVSRQLKGQGVAEGFPKDPNAPKLVRDRKTGKQYDPNKEFEKKMTSPDVMAQMKRMAKKEGVAEEQTSALSRAVSEAGWGRRYSSYHDELSSRERAEQDYMDQSKRDFKRAEMQHELGHEDDPNFERNLRQQQIDKDRGPWYIRIDGKVYKQKGVAKSFDWKRGANNYALAMIKNNPSLQGKVLLTKSAEDK
jgi:hypothetical protein